MNYNAANALRDVSPAAVHIRLSCRQTRSGRRCHRYPVMPRRARRSRCSGRSWHDLSVTDPAREIADLRAGLTVTLRLAQRESGPEGLTVLSVPSDRELIDEVGRLRQLADQADAAKPPAE